MIHNAERDLLVFYCGDGLRCHAGRYVLGCRFQSGPHGCKALRQITQNKHRSYIFIDSVVPYYAQFTSLITSNGWKQIRCEVWRGLPCTPLAATTMAPSMVERPSLSFFIDSGISLPPCFFTCGANSRPTWPATVHTPSTAATQH